MISTDLEMGLKHYIRAEVEAGGSIAIPAKKFSDILHSLPDGQDVELHVDEDKKIYLKCGRSKFWITGAPKNEYPVLPEFNEKSAFKASIAVLTEMVRKTVFAASTDETRYVLNGVFWIADDDALEMVATDGRRLAMIKKKEISTPKPFRVIVPCKILQEFLRLQGGARRAPSETSPRTAVPRDVSGAERSEPEDIRPAERGSASNKEPAADSMLVAVTENQIAFRWKDTTLLSRLVDGSFPNYEQVVPVRRDIQAVVGTEDLLAITRRAALCVADRGGAVRFALKAGSLHVSSSSQNLEFQDELAVDYKGDEFQIGFNPQYLVDAIRNVDADRIRLSFTSPMNPALLEPEGKDAEPPSYRYVVMPMRV